LPTPSSSASRPPPRRAGAFARRRGTLLFAGGVVLALAPPGLLSASIGSCSPCSVHGLFRFGREADRAGLALVRPCRALESTTRWRAPARLVPPRHGGAPARRRCTVRRSSSGGTRRASPRCSRSTGDPFALFATGILARVARRGVRLRRSCPRSGRDCPLRWHRQVPFTGFAAVCCAASVFASCGGLLYTAPVHVVRDLFQLADCCMRRLGRAPGRWRCS